ncbi:MAG TPA: bifunctional riboflavin kinase/FAD synthetase [Steroidobacteraceae bacterium]|jgi:riboflavin kinase/FMN adenylyltransferase
MELIRRLDSVHSRDCVVTIGSFDGLHLGHRVLIDRVRAHAARLKVPAMMVTFEPLPREYLQAANPPARLTNFRERWRLLSAYGLERLCVLSFGERLRNLTGPQFMQLLAAAGTRCIVVGHDFRFGRGGATSAAWCAEHAAEFGFGVELVAAVPIDGERVSSGRVRSALEVGEFVTAHRLLGRAYSMRGRVRHGNKFGRSIGFPTANLPVKRRRAPLKGVFAVRVSGPGFASRAAVANLGTRPMVHGNEMLLEAYLFDFDADLYGQELEVEFVARLRDEATFPSMDAMVQQMRRDAAEARRALGA